MEGFKLFGGSQIEDVGKYVLDYVTKYPETMVFIGTDSTQLRKITLYATSLFTISSLLKKICNIFLSKSSLREKYYISFLIKRIW